MGFLEYQTGSSSRMGEKVGGSSMEAVTTEKGVLTHEECGVRNMEGQRGMSTLEHTMFGR